MGDRYPEVPLEEVVQLQRGFDLPEQDRRSGPVPVVASTGIAGWHDQPMVDGPGVVIGRSGSIGGGQYVRVPFWPLNTTLWVKDFKGAAPRFCYYLLRSIDFSGFNAGSGVPTLNRNHIASLRVRRPPRPAQDAIAETLGILDDKIELNRRMNETLEAMARALFKSWFVDFDPVRAKAEGRAPFGMDAATAALFPDGFEESELGEVPRGWTVGPLGNHLQVIETGGRPRGGVKGFTSGVPSVGAESILRVGYFDYSKTKYVPRDYFVAMRKGVVADRDVLLYKDGGRPGEFEPHVAMFGDEFPFAEFCINEHVYRLRGDQHMPQGFLYFSLSSDRMMEEMRVKGTGVAVPGLNSTALRSLRLLLPCGGATQAFAQVSDPLVDRIIAGAKESHTLGTLRDTLLPKLLSGELRVREADRIVEQAV